MPSQSRYRVNGPRVIQEGFDNEIIVVNLDSGRYYCLQDTGAEVWTLLVQGRREADVLGWLTRRYEGDRDAMAAAVASLCDQLCAEALLVVDEQSPAAAAFKAAPDAASENDAVVSPRPFVTPALQVFTDMQDLLLLDPIHEVDPAGWPMARREDTNQPR